MIQSTKGFTIIEILFSVVLLSVIILAVLGSLGGLFGLNKQTNQQADATNQAQAVVEEFKGQWQDRDSGAYAKSCLKVTVAGTAMNNATVQVLDEDSAGNSLGNSSYGPVYATDCSVASGAAGATSSPLKRISVTVTNAQSAAGTTTLITEIAAP